ncbi:MAG: septal ring lytic transglycosylase RlpA family protein [Campylobacterales bacterium]|nr:septal ring lytic transglycosylase RlpA family protein [Campylobacterales bacterium]
MKNFFVIIVTFGMIWLIIAMPTGCESKSPKEDDNHTSVKKEIESEVGIASYYANALHGKPTASGERYDKDALTAAHKTLPFGTYVKVTMLESNKSVVVRINDRGSHSNKRLIDLSYKAAKEIGLIQAGIAKVIVEY